MKSENSNESVLALRHYVDENAMTSGATAKDFRSFEIDTAHGTIYGYALDPSPDYQFGIAFINGLPHGWKYVKLTMIDYAIDNQMLTNNEDAAGDCIDMLTNMNIGKHDLERVDHYDWGYTESTLESDTNAF